MRPGSAYTRHRRRPAPFSSLRLSSLRPEVRPKPLIRAAKDALPPGGAFIAVEALIDDARRENLFGLLMSLNLLIEFGDAFDSSAADFRGRGAQAGFQRFETIHLAGPSSAYK